MGCLEENSIQPINFRNINIISSLNEFFNIGFFEEL